MTYWSSAFAGALTRQTAHREGQCPKPLRGYSIATVRTLAVCPLVESADSRVHLLQHFRMDLDESDADVVADLADETALRRQQAGARLPPRVHHVWRSALSPIVPDDAPRAFV
jgi:hypothetical protein